MLRIRRTIALLVILILLLIPVGCKNRQNNINEDLIINSNNTTSDDSISIAEDPIIKDPIVEPEKLPETEEAYIKPKIISVDISSHHIVSLYSDGTVKAICSDNSHRELNVIFWTNIVDIAAGQGFTIGLKEDGRVVGVGQIDIVAFSVKKPRTRPVNINEIVADWHDIVAVYAGGGWVIGLKKDGTVNVAGNMYLKEIDLSEWHDIVDVSGNYSFIMGLRSDGTVVATGSIYREEFDKNTGYYVQKYSDAQDVFNDWHDIKLIAVGSNFAIGMQSNGKIVSYGSNRYGQLDTNEEWCDIIAIAAGNGIAIGLKADGTVVSTGKIYYGEREPLIFLDVSEWCDIVAIDAGDIPIGVKSDGTLVEFGSIFFQYLNVLDMNKL